MKQLNSKSNKKITLYDRALKVSTSRLIFIMLCISFGFFIIISRLFYLSIAYKNEHTTNANKYEFSTQRASIVDRNGELLATNISTASIYSNPQEISNHINVAKQIKEVLPLVNEEELLNKLRSKKSFVWIKRHLSPKEQQMVHNLAIPGIYFTRDEVRRYPQTYLFAHSVGYVNIDSQGLAGLEKYYDTRLISDPKTPLIISLDARVQSIVQEELSLGIKLNEASGGSAVVMDINNGELIAMVGLPNFDPHNIDSANDRQKFNQLTLGTYEMGSTFKAITTATAIDLNKIQLNDAFNVSLPLKLGNFTIHDFKGKNGFLTIPEILIYSSNKGTAQIAYKIGIVNQQQYMKNFGLLDKLTIEIPEKSSPRFPPFNRWNDISLVTISYGHGIAVTPLHLVQAIASIVNGGFLVNPTLIKGNTNLKSRIISDQTSNIMRKMLRLVVTSGSGRKSNIEGYFLGGKTGTAEKICGKGYCKNNNIALYVCAYPIQNPQYIILVMIDEPKRNQHNGWLTSGGAVSTSIVKELVKRISPVLKVNPVINDADMIEDNLKLDFKPRLKT